MGSTVAARLAGNPPAMKAAARKTAARKTATAVPTTSGSAGRFFANLTHSAQQELRTTPRWRRIEVAQKMAGYSNAKTTGLYGPTQR